eukprot:scaffold217_cov377-Prasinococcus_capsulatus_cf.AAC.21
MDRSGEASRLQRGMHTHRGARPTANWRGGGCGLVAALGGHPQTAGPIRPTAAQVCALRARGSAAFKYASMYSSHVRPLTFGPQASVARSTSGARGGQPTTTSRPAALYSRSPRRHAQLARAQERPRAGEPARVGRPHPRRVPSSDLRNLEPTHRATTSKLIARQLHARRRPAAAAAAAAVVVVVVVVVVRPDVAFVWRVGPRPHPNKQTSKQSTARQSKARRPRAASRQRERAAPRRAATCGRGRVGGCLGWLERRRPAAGGGRVVSPRGAPRGGKPPREGVGWTGREWVCAFVAPAPRAWAPRRGARAGPCGPSSIWPASVPPRPAPPKWRGRASWPQQDAGAPAFLPSHSRPPARGPLARMGGAVAAQTHADLLPLLSFLGPPPPPPQSGVGVGVEPCSVGRAPPTPPPAARAKGPRSAAWRIAPPHRPRGTQAQSMLHRRRPPREQPRHAPRACAAHE